MARYTTKEEAQSIAEKYEDTDGSVAGLAWDYQEALGELESIADRARRIGAKLVDDGDDIIKAADDARRFPR